MPNNVDFFQRQGDTLPSLEAVCKDRNGVVDLTNALNARFRMVNRDSKDVIVDALASIADAPGGTLRYDWQAADVAEPGYFLASFEVTFTNGTMSFPKPGYLLVAIDEDQP